MVVLEENTGEGIKQENPLLCEQSSQVVVTTAMTITIVISICTCEAGKCDGLETALVQDVPQLPAAGRIWPKEGSLLIYQVYSIYFF